MSGWVQPLADHALWIDTNEISALYMEGKKIMIRLKGGHLKEIDCNSVTMAKKKVVEASERIKRSRQKRMKIYCNCAECTTLDNDQTNLTED